MLALDVCRGVVVRPGSTAPCCPLRAQGLPSHQAAVGTRLDVDSVFVVVLPGRWMVFPARLRCLVRVGRPTGAQLPGTCTLGSDGGPLSPQCSCRALGPPGPDSRYCSPGGQVLLPRGPGIAPPPGPTVPWRCRLDWFQGKKSKGKW